LASKRLYLTNDAASGSFPAGTRAASETSNASAIVVSAGHHSNSAPGNTDAGRYNPNATVFNNTLSTEIDNQSGSSPSNNRVGWIFDQDLTGQILAAGSWTAQLRIDAPVGGALSSRIMARLSVVTVSGSVYTEVAQLLTTEITGETSHTNGQLGWRNSSARITVATAVANYSVTFTTGATHTFAAGERLLIELGFGDANSATQRTWRLTINTADSYLDTPDISAGGVTGSGALAGTGASSSGAGTVRVAGAGGLAGTGASTAGAGTVRVSGSGALAGTGAAAAGAGTVAVSGTGALAGTGAATAGAGTVSTPGVTGSGSLAGTGAALAAAGEVRIAGTGALAGAGASIAAAGQVAISGTGALAGTGAAGAGAGAVAVAGTGALAGAGASAAGAGTVAIAGSGALQAAGASTEGSGLLGTPITGIGALVGAGASLDGGGTSGRPTPTDYLHLRNPEGSLLIKAA
jgi:hypothetical protein